jgi:hypothetical protein
MRENQQLMHLLVFTHILTKCTVQEAKKKKICTYVNTVYVIMAL